MQHPPNEPKAKDLSTTESVRRYAAGSASLRGRLGRLRGLREGVTESIRRNGKRVALGEEDLAVAREKLEEVRQKVQCVQQLHDSQRKVFKRDMESLQQLRDGIRQQTQEVLLKTQAMDAAAGSLQFANQLSDDVCSAAREAAFAASRRCAVALPPLRLWMASDQQVCSTLYAAAAYEGARAELMAHFRLRQTLETFGGEYGNSSREHSPGRRATMKQVGEEGAARSELMDIAHLQMARRLRSLHKHCAALGAEVALREALKDRLSGLGMELAMALEDDVVGGMAECERRAVRGAVETVADMHRSMQEWGQGQGQGQGGGQGQG
ncbi:hypothetical protein B484DRAFT_415357, partial [Ochromonadaceae sp. CCMP2298]